MRFEKKVAIVTGGAGGIGLATAKRLASEGAEIVLADLDEQKLHAVIATIKTETPKAIVPAVCNVSKEADVVATIEVAKQQFGSVDVIVNNAGLMIFKAIEEQTGEDWMNILQVDLLGAFFFIKHAFLQMQPGGAIVNVSSIHAIET